MAKKCEIKKPRHIHIGGWTAEGLWKPEKYVPFEDYMDFLEGFWMQIKQMQQEWKSNIRTEIAQTCYAETPDAGMAKAMIALRLDPDAPILLTESAALSSRNPAEQRTPPWKAEKPVPKRRRTQP